MAPMRAIILISLAGVLLATGAALAHWELPKLPAPHEYGNVTMDRHTASRPDIKPVVFSHLSHRTRYTCRVCHFELEFAFKANATGVTEKDNVNGLFCGACHNGTTAFPLGVEHCNKCHAGRGTYERKKHDYLMEHFPSIDSGDRIDWVRAMRRIDPVYSIFVEDERPFRFAKDLLLTPEWFNVSPAIFPHRPHVRQLDCANCHPTIFNIRRKGTEHFRMEFIIEGKFCGVCHGKVSFPLDECARCHPGMRQ